MKRIVTLFLTVVIAMSFILPVSADNYSVVCAPQYNMADSLSLGVAKVSKDSKWALADKSGNAITGYNWESIGAITSDYIPAKKDGKWGYIDKRGKVLVPYQFISASTFDNSLAMVRTTDGVCGYIDLNGNLLFESPFDYSFPPSEGAICGLVGDFYGYCDTLGSIIIPPKYTMAYDFHEGYAAVLYGGKWGYISSYGEFLINPAYDYAGDFKNGYAICGSNGKYGIINKSGTKTVPFRYDFLSSPDDSGRFPAKMGDTSGYINARGEWLIKTDYDFCYGFTNGIARVFKDGLWGYINENGEELIPPIFTDCGEYHENIAPYSLDGLLWGYLSLEGVTPVVPNLQNPETTAPPVTEPEPTPVTPGDTPSNPADVTTDPDMLPLLPTVNNCISLKIGSYVAYSGVLVRNLSAAPMLYNDTTLIPARDVVELIGGTVSWDNKNQRVVLTYNDRQIAMNIGKKAAFTKTMTIPLSTAPILLNGFTMVPLRDVTEALGFTVEWINSSKNIYIYYN